MIFNLWPRLLIKVSEDERHVFDRSRLMYTEVAEIEKVTGLSYGEWERELGRYSITAIGALVHVLRKRDGQPSDYATMQFNAASMDVVPLHGDGTEYTPEEAAAELTKRIADAEADPTPAAAGAVAPEEGSGPGTRTSTPGSSPNGSGSAPGNGSGSPGRTSAVARRTSTRS